MDTRYGRAKWGDGKPRVRTSRANWIQPLKWDRDAAKAGTRPRVFCASLSDWLDEQWPIQWLADALTIFHATPHLDWLLLSKRPQNWRARLDRAIPLMETWSTWAAQWQAGDPPANVWLGTSVEDQKRADERIPALIQIPARVHFLSVEPLLGPVEFPTHQVSWVIVGGESGPNARPMDTDWARSIRDDCVDDGTPFFFKQLGGRGKDKGGDLLDGRQWHQFPEVK